MEFTDLEGRWKAPKNKGLELGWAKKPAGCCGLAFAVFVAIGLAGGWDRAPKGPEPVPTKAAATATARPTATRFPTLRPLPTERPLPTSRPTPRPRATRKPTQAPDCLVGPYQWVATSRGDRCKDSRGRFAKSVCCP